MKTDGSQLSLQFICDAGIIQFKARWLTLVSIVVARTER
jgi:hypothetical protein